MGSMRKEAVLKEAVLSHKTAVSIPSERPGGTRRALLVVIAGPELGRQIDLESGEVDIGRDEGVTLRIDSDAVSRRHATIRRFAGRFAIADLHSTNGTFVNERRIKTQTLKEGDHIRVGKVVFKYTESPIEAQYHEQIVQLATLDALTGAHNKRYFEETSKKAFTASRQTSTPLALVLFDIDHFKKINDTLGHSAGDAVLSQVAQIVRARLRKRDIFCRVGGEEFALVLEGTSLADARGAAESLRGAIETAPLVFEGSKIPVTTSFGVAGIEATDASAEALYNRADVRLYEAKRSGRNRVC
jgi:diguanylate cyclase (GGDEF)-like protein